MLWGGGVLPRAFHLVLTEFLMSMQISGSSAPAVGRTSGTPNPPQRTQAAQPPAAAAPATASTKASTIPSASASGLGALINVAA